jgi:hypothetical protein
MQCHWEDASMPLREEYAIPLLPRFYRSSIYSRLLMSPRVQDSIPLLSMHELSLSKGP